MFPIQPLLSIVIPAYNAEKYIQETIESALSQTVSDYEIIIVNDGSVDRTEDVIQSYAHHPQIRLHGYRINRGAPHAYNHGILHSTGRYLTILDADDVLMPTYCERVIELIEREQADMGFANFYAIEGTKKLSTTLYGLPREPRYQFAFGGENGVFPANHELLRKMILQAVHISPRAVYKRSLFLDYGLEDHRLRISHDWLRQIKFVINGAKCVYVNEPLGYYRFHSEGNSQKNQIDNNVEIIKVLEIVLKEMRSLLSNEEVQIATMNMHYWRKGLMSVLANSDASMTQIISFLTEKRF